MHKQTTRCIAFHLPQFHEIPENNLWWGKGFTEWTKVKAATPLFKNHRQPRVPFQLNYYDLSSPDTLIQQAELARSYGLSGFCFYHYWFNGKRLLESPLETMLKERQPDFPFMLAWANEPWTRAWNEGGEREVLMPQEYGSKEDWRNHFDCLVRFFKDERYIKIGNKPVLPIYRPESIPNLEDMLCFWQDKAKESGFDGLYFVRMLTCYSDIKWNNHLFDAELEFEPGYCIANTLPLYLRGKRKFFRLLMKICTVLPSAIRNIFIQKFSYELVTDAIVNRKISSKKVFPGVFVDWDNTPRRGVNGMVFSGFSPEKFGSFLARQISKAEATKSEFIFINAWNEWAEGAYLEPDLENGCRKLEAVQLALQKNELN
jgi:hypothetical protein